MLAEEPLRLLLRGAKGRLGHCRRHWRHRAGGLAPAGVGGAVAKRPLLAILSELAVNTVVAPGGRLCGGDGAIERPRRNEVCVVGDPSRRHICLGKRVLVTDIAPVVPCLLSRRALGLGHHGQRAGGTAVTTASQVVEDAATCLGGCNLIELSEKTANERKFQGIENNNQLSVLGQGIDHNS